MTGVKLSTQYMIIKRWLSRGRQVVSKVGPGMKVGKKKLTVEQEAYLASPATLESMRHLSLNQRANNLRDKFELSSFSSMTLWRCYKRLKVRYLKPNLTYDNKLQKIESLREL
jgi:transposase